MCGIKNLTLLKVHTSGVNACIMVICRQQKKILSTRTGLQAKHLSKSIREKEQLRAEWNKQKYAVIYALVAVKYRDPTLRK